MCYYQTMDLAKFNLNGKYLMLALDHRSSFKKLMNPQNPDSLSDEEVINLKREIIESLQSQFSGLLIDEKYGLLALTDHSKPFLLPVEKTGYTDERGERLTELEYSISQLIEYGAKGAKLLLYFNPDVESAKLQLATAKQVLSDCKIHQFPLFLEIVTYRPDGGEIFLERARLVLDSLKMFIQAEAVPDVFKLEYPGDLDSCKKITGIVGQTPWILLTRGDSFDTFAPELEDAVEAGCVGFLAGRALWQEVCSMPGVQKPEFLQKILPERFKKIVEIVRRK